MQQQLKHMYVGWMNETSLALKPATPGTAFTSANPVTYTLPSIVNAVQYSYAFFNCKECVWSQLWCQSDLSNKEQLSLIHSDWREKQYFERKKMTQKMQYCIYFAKLQKVFRNSNYSTFKSIVTQNIVLKAYGLSLVYYSHCLVGNFSDSFSNWCFVCSSASVCDIYKLYTHRW